MKRKKKRVVYRSYLFWLSCFVVCCDWYLQFAYKSAAFGVENSGVSFGLGAEAGFGLRFVLPIFLLLTAVVLWKRGLFGNLFLVMLLIGGVGNMIPRVIWGHVWDYIRIPIFDLWINLSDVLISVSALSYILVGDDRDTDRLRDG